MKHKSPHEPEADVMNAADVSTDADNLSHLLRLNLAKKDSEPLPLSAILDSVDHLDHSDLQVLKAHVEQRLAI
jgi:hypothetical protein